MNGRSRSGTRDRGSLSIVLMLIIVVVLGGAALVVDGGRALTARRHAANVAEASARAGVASQSLSTGFEPDRAADTALDHALRSGIDADDVIVEIRTARSGAPEIVVTITERRRTVFLVLGGASSLTVRASGAATFVYAT